MAIPAGFDYAVKFVSASAVQPPDANVGQRLDGPAVSDRTISPARNE
jgi:hypothetical protein